MPISEKKKVSNARWDREHMATLGCRVKKEDAEAFKEYSRMEGKTANTVLKEYVYGCIGKKEMIRHDSGEGRQEATGAVQSTGGIPLSSDTLKSAQQAAERTGETVGEFTARAIETQIKRDIASFSLGINPTVTEKKKQDESGCEVLAIQGEKE